MSTPGDYIIGHNNYSNRNESTLSACATTNNNNKKKKNWFRMIALDLDGTLLRSDHTISDETVACLQRLHRRGMIFVLATGRAAHATYSLVVERLNFLLNDKGGIPLVCFDGAMGLSLKISLNNSGDDDDDDDDDGDNNQQTTPSFNKTVLFSLPVPRDVTVRVIQFAKELQCATQYYWNDKVFSNPVMDWHYHLTNLYMQVMKCRTIHVKDDFAKVIMESKGEPSKLLVFCPAGRQEDIYSRFQHEFGAVATIAYGLPGYSIEVLHRDAGKGKGLKRICDEHLNIPIEQCIAFGDSENDLEFIKFAGLGVAMKNARPVIREAAQIQTTFCNDEDGVHRTLEELERQGLLRLMP